MPEPNWRCPSCGHTMWTEFHGNIEFSVVIGCPGCGTAMDRLDPLGEIEAAARIGDPVNLRDFIEGGMEAFSDDD